MSKLNDKQEKDRLAFYALYYGQKVAVIPSYPEGDTEILSTVSNINEIIRIELRYISHISPTEVGDIFSFDGYNFIDRYELIKNGIVGWLVDNKVVLEWDHLNQKQSDYLRRNGYLLPYAGYTTQQLIDLGWVKLRTNN